MKTIGIILMIIGFISLVGTLFIGYKKEVFKLYKEYRNITLRRKLEEYRMPEIKEDIYSKPVLDSYKPKKKLTNETQLILESVEEKLKKQRVEESKEAKENLELLKMDLNKTELLPQTKTSVSNKELEETTLLNVKDDITQLLDERNEVTEILKSNN